MNFVVDHDRDLVATAINERFAELGGDEPVAYADDDDDLGDRNQEQTIQSRSQRTSASTEVVLSVFGMSG